MGNTMASSLLISFEGTSVEPQSTDRGHISVPLPGDYGDGESSVCKPLAAGSGLDELSFLTGTARNNAAWIAPRMLNAQPINITIFPNSVLICPLAYRQSPARASRNSASGETAPPISCVEFFLASWCRHIPDYSRTSPPSQGRGKIVRVGDALVQWSRQDDCPSSLHCLGEPSFSPPFVAFCKVSSMLRTIVGLMAMAFAAQAAAQDDSAAKASGKEFRGQDAQRVAAWLQVTRDQAADYRLAKQDQPDHPLKLLPQAVFRHSQPVRGDDIGAVYLWVDDASAPAALGTVFAYSSGNPGERRVAHEFHSLATTPLVGQFRGAEAWSPAEPGVKWTPVPEAPDVAKGATARLRQMREIGRRFGAHTNDASDNRWELRLLGQPIYQYTAKDSEEKTGGGVFLFCQGTDPELILLLEAHPAGSKLAWHYAVAPFTDHALAVHFDGKEVWSLAKGHRPTRARPTGGMAAWSPRRSPPRRKRNLQNRSMRRRRLSNHFRGCHPAHTTWIKRDGRAWKPILRSDAVRHIQAR